MFLELHNMVNNTKVKDMNTHILILSGIRETPKGFKGLINKYKSTKRWQEITILGK